MHFKSKSPEILDPTWIASLGLHLTLVILTFWVVQRSHQPIPFSQIEMQVVEAPLSPPKSVDIRAAPARPLPVQTPVAAPKKVFGLSQKSLTAAAEENLVVKAGNTVAKEPDSERADPNLEDLPVPTDEYLVTQMPQVGREVRANYPDEARKRGIEGVVVLDLLIDPKGQVRQAVVVSGPEFGLREAAVTAVKQFLFKPAQVGEKPVSVKIRYSYRFRLEK